MASVWWTLSTVSCPTNADCDKPYTLQRFMRYRILSLLSLLVPRSAVLSRVVAVEGATKPSLTSRCYQRILTLICLIRPTPERKKKALAAELSKFSVNSTLIPSSNKNWMQACISFPSQHAETPAYLKSQTEATGIQNHKGANRVQTQYSLQPLQNTR